ncbi:MAG TPA: RDD family protein [Opitutaceae bacterium]|nr:RDD family protein [Opitutaceae bacterium]
MIPSRLLSRALLAAALAAGWPASASARSHRVPGGPVLTLESDDAAAGNPTEGPRSGLVVADQNGDRRTLMGSDHILAGESVPHDAVTVMGSIQVDGAVGHDVKAVMGSARINGTVGHDVTAVMGSVTLGRTAVVDGNVISVGGSVHVTPGAIVRGRVISQPAAGPWGGRHSEREWEDAFPGSDALAPYWNPWTHGLGFARSWIWGLRWCFLGLYLLLALAFPGGLTRCGNQLAQRPGLVVAAAFLGLLALPLVFLLLVVTVIGIPLAVLLLPLAVAAALLFGKASVLGLIGRNLLGGARHPAAAVLVGGFIALALYYVPFLGTLGGILLFVLGLGCSLVSLAPASRRPAAPPPPPPPIPVAPAPPPPPAAPAAAAPPPAAVLPAAALPRAGFWIRMGALFIDLVLMSVLGQALDGLFGLRGHQFVNLFDGRLTLSDPGLTLGLAAYGAILWKTRGTTIGGTVCGLRVMRLDDRAVDWETAIVRALGCFLSAAVCGLGFFWIGWDREKQGWHDKIAGTVVVRTKSAPLV